MSTAEKGMSNDQGFSNNNVHEQNANIARYITPGGHPADSSQVSFHNFS